MTKSMTKREIDPPYSLENKWKWIFISYFIKCYQPWEFI